MNDTYELFGGVLYNTPADETSNDITSPLFLKATNFANGFLAATKFEEISVLFRGLNDELVNYMNSPLVDIIYNKLKKGAIRDIFDVCMAVIPLDDVNLLLHLQSRFSRVNNYTNTILFAEAILRGSMTICRHFMKCQLNMFAIVLDDLKKYFEKTDPSRWASNIFITAYNTCDLDIVKYIGDNLSATSLRCIFFDYNDWISTTRCADITNNHNVDYICYLMEIIFRMESFSDQHRSITGLINAYVFNNEVSCAKLIFDTYKTHETYRQVPLNYTPIASETYMHVLMNDFVDAYKFLNDIRRISNVSSFDRLEYVVKYGSIKIVQYLIDGGATPDKTSVQLAIKYGHTDIVKLLYQKTCARGNDATIFKNSLFDAIKYNRVDIVKYFIDNKFHFPNKYLLYVVKRNFVDMFKYVIKEVPTVVVDRSTTVLLITYGHLGMLIHLTELNNGTGIGVDVRAEVMLAATYGHTKIVKYILNHVQNVPDDLIDDICVKCSVERHTDLMYYLVYAYPTVVVKHMKPLLTYLINRNGNLNLIRTLLDITPADFDAEPIVEMAKKRWPYAAEVISRRMSHKKTNKQIAN